MFGSRSKYSKMQVVMKTWISTKMTSCKTKVNSDTIFVTLTKKLNRSSRYPLFIFTNAIVWSNISGIPGQRNVQRYFRLISIKVALLYPILYSKYLILHAFIFNCSGYIFRNVFNIILYVILKITFPLECPKLVSCTSLPSSLSQ